MLFIKKKEVSFLNDAFFFFYNFPTKHKHTTLREVTRNLGSDSEQE